MPTLEEVRPRPRRRGVKSRALVVFAHGEGLALCYSADEHVERYIHDGGGDCQSFDTEIGCEVYCKVPSLIDSNGRMRDGVYTFEMRLVDDGPGDWPGSRECLLELFNPCPVTAAEWSEHRTGEYPWDPDEKL